MLEKINSPKDIQNLSTQDLKELADDIRQGIMNRVNKVGGHLGPDLGIVETMIALHKVFDSPKDKFVFDVSHQCYPHKMLTGRKQGFVGDIDLKISGFTNPKESEHDMFAIGHCSTSISLACGLAKARDLKSENYNVIALIGDGSLSGGEALEGLNNAAVLDSNFIVVLNDNEMSIPENVGGIYKNLEDLRSTKGTAKNNMFTALGYDYFYEDEGNDIEKMIKVFEQVKDSKKPAVVHVHTLKGKGYKPAETEKERFHWIMPGFLNQQNTNAEVVETYESITKDFILNKKAKNDPVAVVTAATPGVFGFDKEFRKSLGKNYTDVAISEEHAIAFASGLAKNGAKPIVALTSSFIQRTYDQLSQDVCLNNSPVTILVYWGGISGADMTHLCTFDMAMISNIPNLVYLAPTCKEEYLAMLEWSYQQNNYPVLIRVPKNPLVSTGKKDMTDYSVLNKYVIEEQGNQVAILGLGTFFQLGKQVKEELKIKGINASLINPKFITGLDTELLENLKKDHKVVITLEDGELDGGFGEKIARFYGNSEMKVLNYGSFKEFSDRADLKDLYKKYRLMPDLIVEDVLKIC